MFLGALFSIAKTWKQAKEQATEDQIKKKQYIYAMEYCSAIKMATVPFAAIQTDLEIVILSEVSQTQKDKYNMISCICGI